MIDLLLGLGSLVGLVAYGSIAVAVHTVERDQPVTRDRLATAIFGMFGAYGALMAVLATTQHSAAGALPPATLLFPAVMLGVTVVMISGTIALYDVFDPELPVLRAAFWIGIPMWWVVRAVVVPVWLIVRGIVRLVVTTSRLPVWIGHRLAGTPRYDAAATTARIAELERELGIPPSQ